YTSFSREWSSDVCSSDLSSGRLPTQAGLEYYVRSLPTAAEPNPAAAAALDRSLRDAGQHLESDLRATSCVLSGVAGCVAVAFWGASRGGRIAESYVLPLGGARTSISLTRADRSAVVYLITPARRPEQG